MCNCFHTQSEFEHDGVNTELMSISSNEDHDILEKHLKHASQEAKGRDL